MAENFINAGTVLGATDQLIYTCPVGAVAIIIGCQITNEDIDLRDFDLWWTDSSNTDAATYLAKTVKIPPEVSYNPIGGKVVLHAGDAVYAVSDVAAKIHLSLSALEIS